MLILNISIRATATLLICTMLLTLLYAKQWVESAAHNWGLIELTRQLAMVEEQQEIRTLGFSQYQTHLLTVPGEVLIDRLWEAQQRVRPAADLYRKFGKLFYLYGQNSRSLAAYKMAYEQDSNDLEICRELAEAYERVDQQAEANALWRRLTSDNAALQSLADDYFQHRQFGYAYRWYHQLVEVEPEYLTTIAFQYAISGLMTNKFSSEQIVNLIQTNDPTFTIYRISDTTTIEGDQLRWMDSFPTWGVRPGELLGHIDNDSSSVGRFWWTGEAISVLNVQKSAVYEVTIRAQHLKPLPVQMAVGLDGHQLRRFELSRGDQSWETIRVRFDVKEGLRLFSIWFLNNDIIDGQDRDAAIDWITFAEIHYACCAEPDNKPEMMSGMAIRVSV